MSTPRSSYAQDSRGSRRRDAGDRFGASLAVVSGRERALIVGVPDDVDNTSGMVNVIPFGGGPPRYWAPGSTTFPAGIQPLRGRTGQRAGST